MKIRNVLYRFKNQLIITAAFGCLMVIGGFMNSHKATAQPLYPPSLPVLVVNQNANPVPVTGSTTVAGTVAATQSGAWNVGIAGNTPTSPLFVRDMENPGQHTFEIWVEYDSKSGRCFVNCTNFDFTGGGNLIEFDLAAVPAGKRWIITRIAGEINSTSPQISIALQSRTVLAFQDLKAAFFGPFFTQSFPTPLPAITLQGFNAEIFTSYGPGETPHVRIGFANGSAGGGDDLVFGGYLIDN